jgi:Ca2+-binding EF-hand superfamily protein
MNSLRTASLLVPVALAACASPESTQAVSTEGVFDRSEPARVVDAEGSHDTTWDYLLTKYDADGDGTVTRDEYDRGAEAFDGHDRNGDGSLTFADYDPELRRAETERRQAASRAQAVIALYFQDDGNPDRLDSAELERALAAYDAAGDGAVTFDEFEGEKDARRAHGKEPDRQTARRLESGDLYEFLIVAIDANEDGSMTNVEVVAFFGGEADEDGVWNLRPEPREAAAGRPSGPAEGDAAPDFTLARLKGEGTVTLSSFVDDRPVALVFGSYT